MTILHIALNHYICPMPQDLTTKQTRIEKRNEKIRQRFDFLTSKKHFSLEYTLEVLSEEFMPLAETTLWLIISETGYYKKKQA